MERRSSPHPACHGQPWCKGQPGCNSSSAVYAAGWAGTQLFMQLLFPCLCVNHFFCSESIEIRPVGDSGLTYSLLCGEVSRV